MQADTVSSWPVQTEAHYFVVAGVFALILKMCVLISWGGFRADLSTHSALIVVTTCQLFDALPVREHPQTTSSSRETLASLTLLLFSAEEARVLGVGEAPSSTANKLKGVCSLTAVLFANLSCRWAELFGSSSQSRRCDAVSPGRLAGERGRLQKVLSTGQ